MARPDGTGRRRLVAGFDATWSPDARRLAFRGSFNGLDYTLLTVSSAGGPRLRLSHPSVDVFGAAWSPDGREVAYVALARRLGNAPQVLTVTADGRRTRRIASLPPGARPWGRPHWTRDGTRIVVAMRMP
jgi:Tol biopolymer transport system component